MGYIKSSIPKSGDGAGCAIPKDPTIILVDVEDVTAEPTRTVGNIATEGDLTLAEGAKGIGIYATPSTIEEGFELSGEADAKGYKQKISFEHPGDSDEINNFTEFAANRQFIALVKQCDGTSAGKTKIYGSKCNPLVMAVEPTNNKEAAKRKFDFAQEIAGKFLAGVYSGKAVSLADAANKVVEGA